ncbi:hypothetical protein SAMN04487897_102616 [Paenibacillus sp. yr247]|nr:hypothetical protein SAMN04487897_102616 [Paenibacillus sp. yr247]
MSEASNRGSGFDWIGLVSGLPASLIFILVVDWQILPELVNLYKSQSSVNDSLKVYTLSGIGVFVLVNLIIICTFARVRYLQEKARIGSPTPITDNT